MRRILTTRRWIIGAAGLVLAAMPGAAQTPSGPLASLLPGMWQLRSVGGSAAQPTRSICVRNPSQFIQLQHAGRGCQRRVLNESRTDVTVRYECGAAGWGQTQIHVETARLARVDTQGIDGSSPFHHVYEARRTGDCQ